MNGHDKAREYRTIMVGKIYKHFGGEEYVVTDIAVHASSKEVMVVYSSVHDPSLVFVAPMKEFFSKVDVFEK